MAMTLHWCSNSDSKSLWAWWWAQPGAQGGESGAGNDLQESWRNENFRGKCGSDTNRRMTSSQIADDHKGGFVTTRVNNEHTELKCIVKVLNKSIS